MGDVTVLDKVKSENAELKTVQHLGPEKPVTFEERAWNHLGATD